MTIFLKLFDLLGHDSIHCVCSLDKNSTRPLKYNYDMFKLISCLSVAVLFILFYKKNNDKPQFVNISSTFPPNVIMLPFD